MASGPCFTQNKQFSTIFCFYFCNLSLILPKVWKLLIIGDMWIIMQFEKWKQLNFVERQNFANDVSKLPSFKRVFLKAKALEDCSITPIIRSYLWSLWSCDSISTSETFNTHSIFPRVAWLRAGASPQLWTLQWIFQRTFEQLMCLQKMLSVRIWSFAFLHATSM